MRLSWLFLSLAAVGCIREVATPPLATAQTDACSLAAWIMQEQPHTTRTLEEGPPSLRDTFITVNEAQRKISIPEGFTMTVFARNIPQCRGLACSPDGVIYATSFNGNLYAFPDHNHDGMPDSTITIETGLDDPDAIGFYASDLYVSNNAGLYHLITNGQSRVAQRKDTIATFPPQGDHHTRNFVFDTTKKKIYVQIGSKGNLDTTDLAHRAQIVEMNIDGTGYRTYARGLRNAEGLDIDPRTGALWANNNGMDNIFGSGTEETANNPSECVYLVCDGANYGWPWCYGFQIRNPEQTWVNLDTNIVKTFDGPVAEVLAHEAPLSLHFYRGNTFPAMYHNAIFQCYHGSWDRTPPAPPRITVMWIDSDGHNARVTDFVNGFQPDSSSNRWGRPVSIIEGADSALYVSDDQAGGIYRIAWTGPKQTNAVSSSAIESNFSIGNLTPNPARDRIQLDFTVSHAGSVQAELIDLLGNTAQYIKSEEMNAGDHILQTSVASLPSGTYILRISEGNEVLSKEITVVR
jgi:glucose/arabinose dehydrogenase